jgi:hypothetical protein
MKLALLAMALLVAGCTPPARLQYPDGAIVECGTGGRHTVEGQIIQRGCIQDHMAQGARRL